MDRSDPSHWRACTSVAVTCGAEHADVLLLITRIQHGDDGDADAAADVAHQVEQAGGIAHVLARHRRHGDCGERHEDEAEPMP